MMTYLFVDTNVLLHYRRLEEIDWLNLSKSEEVVIVLGAVLDNARMCYQRRHEKESIKFKEAGQAH